MGEKSFTGVLKIFCPHFFIKLATRAISLPDPEPPTRI
jgi:hypothetical protein